MAAMTRISCSFIKVKMQKKMDHLMTLQKVTPKAHLKLNQTPVLKSVTVPVKITLQTKRTMRKYSINNC